MRAGWRVFWEPKLGSAPSEYEDAYWPSLERSGSERFSVADGATESSYSRQWASLLVERYGSGATWKTSFIRAIPDLQARWRSEHAGRALPWYAEEKLRLGSYAAFLGVRLIPREDGARLHVLASGDCELAHIRDGRLHCAFPLLRSTDFGTSPSLVGTNSGPDDLRGLIRGKREDIGRLDRLFLMTDALAAWFLREVESGRKPWDDLQAFQSDEAVAFQTWVDEKRRNHEMRNDDITVGIVVVE